MGEPGDRPDGRATARRRTLGELRPGRWFGGHLLAAVALFVLGAAVGAVAVGYADLDALSRLASGRSVVPETLTVGVILANNLVAAAVTLGGAVTFGLLSALSMLVNGMLVGTLVAVTAGDASLLLLAALLLPHGVVELPALWLAGAVGLRVAHRLVRYLRGVDERPLTRAEAVEVALLVVVVVALIAVAAWIEVHVTPRVAERVAG